MTAGRVAGLLLAAGSGSRLGRPKALEQDRDGRTFLERSLEVLQHGGCASVYVVVGASADEARRLALPDVQVVVAEDWPEGMGASLRAGLAAVSRAVPSLSAAMVMLVDTPGVTAAVVRRLVANGSEGQAPSGGAGGADPLTSAVRRAAYDGVPGHPVLIGRDHWDGVVASARGDRGARDYLSSHAAQLVACEDIGSGDDIDTPRQLADWRAAARNVQ